MYLSVSYSCVRYILYMCWYLPTFPPDLLQCTMCLCSHNSPLQLTAIMAYFLRPDLLYQHKHLKCKKLVFFFFLFLQSTVIMEHNKAMSWANTRVPKHTVSDNRSKHGNYARMHLFLMTPSWKVAHLHFWPASPTPPKQRGGTSCHWAHIDVPDKSLYLAHTPYK